SASTTQPRTSSSPKPMVFPLANFGTPGRRQNAGRSPWPAGTDPPLQGRGSYAKTLGEAQYFKRRGMLDDSGRTGRRRGRAGPQWTDLDFHQFEIRDFARPHDLLRQSQQPRSE